MHKNHSFLLRLLVIVNLICWVQCLPSDAAYPEKRVALVIGNSAYQNTPALPNPRNDATEIGKVLNRLGFEVDVQVDLTKSTLDKVLRQFGDRLEGAQVAVFYYAGHGIQVAGTNYLIPVDATLRKEKDLYFEVSELNLVLQQMEGAQRVNLVFLDACRDNPLSKKLSEGMGSGRSTLIGRGLAPMKASDGTMISYATKDGEVASDGKGKHSPYSQAILNHIEAPMEISQMLRKVREDVKKITDNKQTPWEYGSLTGDFYFTGPIKVEISQEPTKSDSKSKMEALYWQSIMNDNDPAVFESYLKKYPDGEFSDLAKIKISNLEKGQKNEILPSLEQPVQSDSKKAYGYLKLTSDPPGASVLLDGSPLGNTDMDASNIEPGKRKIEIQKDCFKVKTAEVMIKAGQQVSMNLKLEPSCGGISATSDPAGANILIDNKPVGITPAEVMDISEGKHQITIRKDAFHDWQEGIVVKTGKTVAVKSGKLKSTAVGQQAAADTAGLPATPQPEYRLTVDSNPADAKIKLLNIPTKYKKGMMLKPGTYQVEISRDGYEPFNTVAEIKDADVTLPISLKEMARGSIRVTSDPSGASVLMDGKKIGITPLDLADISPGQKKIMVEQNGYKPVTQTASVKSGQQTQLDIRLEALSCVINISSDPSGAEVYVDDTQSGITPIELKNISAGSHRLVIKKNGYVVFGQMITGEPQKPSQVHAVLIQSTKSTSPQPAKSVFPDGTSKNLTTGFVETFSGYGLDSTRWKEWNKDNTKISRQYGKGLTISGGPHEKATGGIISEFYLIGDFDIEVSYEILKWPFYENPQLDRQRRAAIWLYATNKKQKSDLYVVDVFRYNHENSTFEGYGISWTTMGKRQSDNLPKRLNHEKGKLRLKRTKGNFEAFYHESEAWKSLPGYPDSFNMPVKIGLSISNFSSENKVDPTEVEVRFTDLKISLN